jgi:alpha-amylase/alpha-mannosidase (GH57 family)
MADASAQPLDVVLCWHMHQPWYRVDDAFVRPWVYLHALKDYADMASHLEAVPGARAVVNFVPTLVEQIDLYAAEFAAWRERRAPFSDPLLQALATRAMPADPAARRALVTTCSEIAYRRARERHPPLGVLVDFCHPLRGSPDLGRYLSDAAVEDLLVGAHLAWIGEFDRRIDARAHALLRKGSGYDFRDRELLLELVAERIEGLLPRYRTLATRGTIELGMSPWAHPLLPLLLDFASAREASRELALPTAAAYPGGGERARWHFAAGRETFARAFSVRPSGCWPPEAALSDAALALVDDEGFAWAVSSGAVLRQSLDAASHADSVHRSATLGRHRTRIFFRDDGLSDLIGFVYKDWSAGAAVDDLVRHLEHIAAGRRRDDAVVTIALDGENAWEHFPGNGFEFLHTLYGRLAHHPALRLTTFSEHLARTPAAAHLDHLVAGSWVHGSLTTWIGHADKNLAWDRLVEAKRAADAAPRSEALARALGVCEGSDWFWWLGDVHGAEVVGPFDALYRAQLAALYRVLGVAPPVDLGAPLARASGSGAHVMMPTDGPRGASD